MAFLIVGKPSEPTSSAIVDAARELGLEAAALEPARLGRSARVGDIVLGRLCIRASLAGVERGLDDLGRASARGIFVLNPPAALLAASDKLATALRLARAGVPHPRTALVGSGTLPAVGFPAVVKLQELLPVERELRQEEFHRAQLAVLKEVQRIRPSGPAQRAQHLASEWSVRFERALADWAHWARSRVEEGFIGSPD